MFANVIDIKGSIPLLNVSLICITTTCLWKIWLDVLPLGIIGLEAAAILGFSVYVSNTSNVSQGMLCFKDNNFRSSTISAFCNITCPFHGQYVIYYNKRLVRVNYPLEYSVLANNDLCEVEVYGNISFNILLKLYVQKHTKNPQKRNKKKI